ncbi:hypothetical protein J8M21_25410 [Pseudoalteromonas luteoviolacea]|uniref:hypothetical protein n=1 Tax=Pseudoalteromonas luteoviolacea TaxID=43657 RepID=UPI001B3A6647|nr:hypothetical protein [Pseudoalteromonas luteoviolacea]MBQ4880540.1 hypothetical protein [Pseudoalteromonas luteoviolacea]MBQ4909583.1 hypothetical protein [Pseudoalteromonas luteoviolacea]
MKFLKLLFLASLTVPQASYAARFDITADVGQIRYHEASNSLAPAWHKHVWVGLDSPDQNPNCQLFNGQVGISIPDGNEPALSMLLAAKMAGKKVLITIDDEITFPSGKWCKLQYVTIK